MITGPSSATDAALFRKTVLVKVNNGPVYASWTADYFVAAPEGFYPSERAFEEKAIRQVREQFGPDVNVEARAL